MNQNQRNQLLLNLSTLSLLLIAVATVYPLVIQPQAFSPGSGIVWYKYLYGGGAVLMLVCRLFIRHADKDLRLRRLYRIENWSAIFFCVATFFMFYPEGKPRDWLAFTLAGAAIQIFTSLMIPLRQRKVNKTSGGSKDA